MNFFVLRSRSHAPRGNAARDAPRPSRNVFRRRHEGQKTAGRSHAERGNESKCVTHKNMKKNVPDERF